MNLVTSEFKLSPVRLSRDFLLPYRYRKDPFTSLLSRSTYLSKYCRDGESWTDTVLRVVEDNINLDPKATVDEAQQLFDLFWHCQALPSGRGLWTGGVPGIPADARYNCYYVTIRTPEDWCWTANMLMLGGGVGVGLQSIHTLPVPIQAKARFAIWCRDTHPNLSDVQPEGPQALNGSTPVYRVEDSREGWVEALRRTMQSAFNGTDLVVDVSLVRPRGEPIRTFGGVACGPGPLASLLRKVWLIIRGAAGRGLRSIDALDITNHVGNCVKSGNVRRSALIQLGRPDDMDFRLAKSSFSDAVSHRHTSNNSLVFETWDQIQGFDWSSLMSTMVQFGEPGILNLAKARETDPGVQGVNPCFSGDTLVAVADGRNAVTLRELAEKGQDVPVYSMDKKTGKVAIKMGRHPRVTGTRKSLVRVWLDDGGFLDVTPDHKFTLMDGSSSAAKDLVPGSSLPRFTKALEPVKSGGKNYYRVYCDTKNPASAKYYEHRLIARFHDPEGWDRLYSHLSRNGFTRTGGLVVHHKDYNQLNNSPDNLQIMSFRDHTSLHGTLDQSGESNGRWSGFSNETLVEHGLRLTRGLGRRFSTKDWVAYARKQGLPCKFSAFRKATLVSVSALSSLCALELGMDHVTEDPRVVSTYKSMLEQGYLARISEGAVLVTKTCEGCGTTFEVEHSRREQSFCSHSCSNKYLAEDVRVQEHRTESLHSFHKNHMSGVRLDQARVYSDTKFKAGRDINRKEWSKACKEEGVPSRIGPTLRFGFRSFQEVVDSGNLFNHKVVKVEPLPGEHTVYNLTVDDFHTVALISSTASKGGQLAYTGVYVGQCGEVLLEDMESCNLAEGFPAKLLPGVSAEKMFRLLTRYCQRQRLPRLMNQGADAVSRKNMRLGVGLGGVCDFDWTPKLLSYWYAAVRDEADRYARELGVNRSVTLTTVKPSGTVSLLARSSPGMHAPEAPFYIRRFRCADTDPLFPALVEANLHYEVDRASSDGHTYVFDFPEKALHTRVTKQTQTVRDQLDRQVALQRYWSDNSVSATITFSPEDQDQIPDLLREYVPQLKSVSLMCLAHGYDQAPYEAIDQGTYKAMESRIDQNHPLVHGGDIGVDECSSGACPIR